MIKKTGVKNNQVFGFSKSSNTTKQLENPPWVGSAQSEGLCLGFNSYPTHDHRNIIRISVSAVCLFGPYRVFQGYYKS